MAVEMVKTKKIESTGEKVFDFVVVILLTLVGIICVYPLLYVLACSISYGPAVDAGKVFLIPEAPNLESYKQVLSDRQFWVDYGNTLFYTFFGTLFSMLVSIPAAYALSKKYRFKARKTINLLLSLTMWFNPGFIPKYLNYASLGALNNRWMIVVSFGVRAFYIILLRNFFESVPKEIEESATLDGASDFSILTFIYLPLSKAAIATVCLYYAISRWNGYFWSSVLLSDLDKIPLQVYIKQKVIDQSLVSEYASMIAGQNYSYNTLIYALVICSIIPMLILYPFIQKYFVKGIMAGGVKG